MCRKACPDTEEVRLPRPQALYIERRRRGPESTVLTQPPAGRTQAARSGRTVISGERHQELSEADSSVSQHHCAAAWDRQTGFLNPVSSAGGC
jgi:hypothetical protein